MEATDAEVKAVMDRYLEYLKSLDRDPQNAFCNRISAVNFGDSIFYKVSYNISKLTTFHLNLFIHICSRQQMIIMSKITVCLTGCCALVALDYIDAHQSGSEESLRVLQ